MHKQCAQQFFKSHEVSISEHKVKYLSKQNIWCHIYKATRLFFLFHFLCERILLVFSIWDESRQSAGMEQIADETIKQSALPPHLWYQTAPESASYTSHQKLATTCKRRQWLNKVEELYSRCFRPEWRQRKSTNFSQNHLGFVRNLVAGSATHCGWWLSMSVVTLHTNICKEKRGEHCLWSTEAPTSQFLKNIYSMFMQARSAACRCQTKNSMCGFDLPDDYGSIWSWII